MTPIIISLLATWLAIERAPLVKPELSVIDMRTAPCTTTLKIPESRPYIQTGSILLFKFTDAEWDILTNTFSQSVVRDQTNVVSFCGTNEWSREHPWKKP